VSGDHFHNAHTRHTEKLSPRWGTSLQIGKDEHCGRVVRVCAPLLHILPENRLDGQVTARIRRVAPNMQTSPLLLEAVMPISVHLTVVASQIATGVHVENPELLLVLLKDRFAHPPILSI